jgi:hypothetical protein
VIALAPRLLTDKAAAAYLSLPVACVRRLQEGRVIIDGRLRWDRVKLDALLDGHRRPGVQSPANENLTEADAALDRFLETQRHAAGSP